MIGSPDCLPPHGLSILYESDRSTVLPNRILLPQRPSIRTSPSYGFGPTSHSWLPQPAQWAELSVEAQQGQDGSTLEFYREALRIRKASTTLGGGDLKWLDHVGDVLAFTRTSADGSSIISVLNLNNDVVHLPIEWGRTALIASSDDIAFLKTEGSGEFLAVGPETAVWLTQ